MSRRFKVSAKFPVPPERIYRAWLSSKDHSAMTGAVAKITPRIGEVFSAWDGYITGRTLDLEPNTRIVQAWRTSEFGEDDPDSKIEVLLEPDGAGTIVTLIHSDIPEGEADNYRAGWEEWYFSPMREYFSGK